jgi:hypothetical protein
MNRKPLRLTEEQINGEKPADAAWQLILLHLEGLKGEERTEYIRYLPQCWRAIYTGIRLQNEVNNGGYHQFFWNSGGLLSKETLEDLQLISAGPFILLFEEAIDEYRQHDYRAAKMDSSNSWEAFAKPYEERRMADLDEAFCKVPRTIAMYLSDYIRNNRMIFRQTVGNQ